VHDKHHRRVLSCPFYLLASLRLLPKRVGFCTFRLEVLAAKEDQSSVERDYSCKKLVNKGLYLESRWDPYRIWGSDDGEFSSQVKCDVQTTLVRMHQGLGGILCILYRKLNINISGFCSKLVENYEITWRHIKWNFKQNSNIPIKLHVYINGFNGCDLCCSWFTLTLLHKRFDITNKPTKKLLLKVGWRKYFSEFSIKIGL
jgi:hypothetical protein